VFVVPKYKFDQIAFNSTEKKKPTEDDKYTYIGLEHLDSGCLEVTRYGSDVAPIGEKLVMRKGDVLFGKRRAYQKKVAIAPFDGIFSAHGLVLRPKEDVVERDFFPFFISSDYFLDAAIKISVGSLSPTINWRELKELEFELPDLAIQRDLAKIFMAMNEAKKAYKELITQTEQLVQSQFIEMFGNPNDTQTEFVVTDALEIRDDLRKPLNDGVRSTMYEGTLYPYYGANGKVDEINQYLMDCDAICLAEDCGSYSAGEPSSYIVSGKVWVNNHAHILIPKANCNIRFANEYFRLLDITQYISGTTRAKLTQGQLKILPMMIPDIEKQEAFCTLIEQFDKSKFAAKQALENLERTQKSLMNRYLG